MGVHYWRVHTVGGCILLVGAYCWWVHTVGGCLLLVGATIGGCALLDCE